MIEFTLASANTTKIKSQGRKATLLEHVKQIIDNLVVHGSTELGVRVRMKNNRYGGSLVFGRLVTTFKSAGWTIKNYFRHRFSE
jgi:hypothetical protein